MRLRRHVLPILLIVGMVPCYTLSAVSLLSSTTTAVSLLPLPPFRPCASRIRAARRSELLSSSTWHLAMNRSAASRTPRYHFFHTLFVAWTHRVRFQLQTGAGRLPWSLQWFAKRRGRLSRCSEPVVRWPTCNPGFIPPVIYANIRLRLLCVGNRSLICRAIAPAKKSHRFRMYERFDGCG